MQQLKKLAPSPLLIPRLGALGMQAKTIVASVSVTYIAPFQQLTKSRRVAVDADGTTVPALVPWPTYHTLYRGDVSAISRIARPRADPVFTIIGLAIPAWFAHDADQRDVK